MTFSLVEEQWVARLGNIRNVVRQYLIDQQLRAHVGDAPSLSVLDVGCGQGTQAIRLATDGHQVTGVDPSPELLARMQAAARSASARLNAVEGSIEDLDELPIDESYDLVCAHGVLMYLDAPASALARLAGRLRPGGLLSFTVRNGDALAFRPGIRRQWGAALAAFDATAYVNELGIEARAHGLGDVSGWCDDLGLVVEAWYGVRVFSDGASGDEVPAPSSLDDLLQAELEAGRRDPYRRLGSQLHIIARRSS